MLIPTGVLIMDLLLPLPTPGDVARLDARSRLSTEMILMWILPPGQMV
jgi:hypothetical protein